MIGILKANTPTTGLLVSATMIAMTGLSWAAGKPAVSDTPAVLETAMFNGLSCDHVRAKVAESGVTAAYAYARYMGLSSRDIARVRKACSV